VNDGCCDSQLYSFFDNHQDVCVRAEVSDVTLQVLVEVLFKAGLLVSLCVCVCVLLDTVMAG